MKKILLLCLITQGLMAQPKPVQSKINNVTVFPNGAQITRSAHVSLAIGKTEMIFKGISPQINKQSIQVKSEANLTILSVVHQAGNLLDKAKQEEINEVELQKTLIEDKIRAEKNSLLVFKREEEMLLKNQVVGGTYAGMKIADFKESVDYQRARMHEALSKQLEIEKNLRKLEAEMNSVNQALTLINTAKDAILSEIIVTVQCKEPVNDALFTIDYFVPNAGWLPTYDLRIKKLTEPITLAYKANVYQYSGEDWKDIRLSLSTATPGKNADVPKMKDWILGENNDYSDYYENINASANQSLTEVQGRVISKNTRKALAGVSVFLKGTALGTTTDMNGNYKINIPPLQSPASKTLVFSLRGMQTKEDFVSSDKLDIELEEDIEGPVVVGYVSSKRRDVTGAVTSRRNERGKVIKRLDIEAKEAPTSQLFEILMPYTIPSDARVYTVELKEEHVQATFEHISIPKIDPDVFLHAHIIDWEKYKLLSGEASLFIENTFVGKSKLNLTNKDTLSISFGRDKGVIVSRNKVKSYQKKQFIGFNKSEQSVYEIIARNTRNEAVNLIIEDQFPVSKSREVSVEDQEAPEAEINAEKSRVKWRLNLAPAKEYKLSLKYTIKSPKSGYIEAE